MQERKHVVVLPLPTRGHVNPMLRLTGLLADAGHLVTLVCSDVNYSLLGPEAPEVLLGRGIRLAALPDGLPKEADRTTQVLQMCETVLSAMPEPFEELLNTLSPSPSCIVADTWLTFTVAAASRRGIPHISFWTQSAASLASLFLVANNLYRGPAQGAAEPKIPGAAFLTEVDMNTFVRCYNPADFMYRFVTGGFNCLPQSKWVVVNTFEDLELQTIHGLRELYGLKNLLAIGPLLPQNLCATSRSDFQAKLTSFFWREDETCLSWLDKHEPKSVLYVSFGSLALISSEQIEEVALALEASGHPFLWVARSDLIHGRSPTFNEDYLLRVKDHSCFVTWAPQLQVLRHPSIGVFFTHGGWNSTIEAITAGVPMLGWPYFSDQPMDCTCIEGWGLGLKLSDGMGDGKIVPKCTIESKIRSVMSSKAFRERAHNLKMLAEKGLPGIRCSKDFQTLLDSL